MEPLTGRIPRDQNRTPVMGGVSSSDGKTVLPVEINPSTGRVLVDSIASGGGTGLVPFSYDYIAYTNTSSTVDTYVYKTGGSGGTTVATITITYTDTTKTQISTVART
jgi:Tfp pilus assembly protein PilW